MKSDKKLLTAFSLNFAFAVFEFFGGIFTGSVAIASDALHDFGDSVSIGLAYLLERKSRKKPDSRYTFGYIRYSLLGAVITNFILLVGSATVIWRAVLRLINPTEINYNGMMVFAVVGFCTNLAAALLTGDKNSHSVKAVNLHLLEDTLGWAIVLAGAIIMRFTDIRIIDPIMSIALSLFIGFHAVNGLKETLEIFLLRVPNGIDPHEIEHHICEIGGVKSLHHLHLYSLDGYRHAATLHIVVSADAAKIKAAVRNELAEHGFVHTVIETENENEECSFPECHLSEFSPHLHQH